MLGHCIIIIILNEDAIIQAGKAGNKAYKLQLNKGFKMDNGLLKEFTNSGWLRGNQALLEKELQNIIKQITSNTADSVFDYLEKIQHLLAIALWKDKITLSDYLDRFTRFFDRLDSKEEREYIKNNIWQIKEQFSANKE